MAWIFLGENLNNIDIFGFFIATIGVYIATEKKIKFYFSFNLGNNSTKLQGL